MRPAIDGAELARIVRGVDPAAFVVPGRVVRRAIKHDRGLPKLLFRVPHRLVFAIERVGGSGGRRPRRAGARAGRAAARGP